MSNENSMIEFSLDKPGDEMLSILQEEIKQFQTKLDDKHEMFISQDGADFCILQIQIII